MSRLEVRDVSGGYADMNVVRGVSLSVEPGRTTAILGRNGAGKTTLLRLISGLNPLRHGSIKLGDQEIGKLSAHRRVSRGLLFVQEGKRIFKERTVTENLVLGAFSRRLGKVERKQMLDEAFSRFPALGDKKDVPAGSLSGGQQQMLAISQALAARPAVLMLDEPTTGLAPAIVEDMVEVIRSLGREGLGVLLVEQSIDFCLEVSDHAIVLNLGRVRYSGPCTDPRIRSEAEAAYLGVT